MKASVSKRIFIIEDNVTYRKLLKMRLDANGYITISAKNGLEGLNTARKEKPDLIILDLMLPIMDGHRVCRMIKFDRKIRHIPIIILTCRNFAKDVDLAKKCHVDAFVLKTTKVEMMLYVINKLLAKEVVI